ncbi:NnrU family protein [Thiococcus pfennigii]|jgi:uncharacterized membrane protein|uniref:NnrU family protein n=1 Tax=Thiococcus pfennigii TaxID=1057 RepID=UPI00190488C2|nr:NnrU family protein [Thiococcus pfennigii]MBK1701012.1 hypothetical protein [Thiococcus pfennigii]MBK1731390.1 hypothetical protein [Thiococcus pfennigii]
MILLVLGLALFFTVHMLPSFPGAYQRLHERFGEQAFKGGFAILSLVGIVLAVIGMGMAPTIDLWQPGEFTKSIAPGLMLPAFMLLVLAYVPSNVRRYIRHPMLTAVLLWGLAHLLANGDLASMILFGSFAVYSVVAMVSANRRGAKKATDYKSMLWDLVGAGGGIGVYALFVYLHPYLFGVPALLPST